MQCIYCFEYIITYCNSIVLFVAQLMMTFFLYIIFYRIFMTINLSTLLAEEMFCTIVRTNKVIGQLS